MFFLTPKYLKQGRLYIKEAKKRLAYNRDRWSDETIGEFNAVIASIQSAVKARDKKQVEEATLSLEGLCARHCPPNSFSVITENVEVFLVAFIVALGIRTFFLQPFTIPTSSMYPTLCGVIGTKTEQDPPNYAVQAWQFALYGRTWHNVVAEADEEVTAVEETNRPGLRRFFTYTKISTRRVVSETSSGSKVYETAEYFVNDLKQPIQEAWGRSSPGTGPGGLVGLSFKKGEPIVRGYTSTGDHVFVDKVSYHFRRPTRGEVFVFTTAYIPGHQTNGSILGAPPLPPSQFYIKRLGGVPGDQIRVVAPNLYINDELAKEPTLQRVMKGTPENPVAEYRGYSGQGDFAPLKEHEYFALGDNSYNSLDSRMWGTVPERNIMGPGFLVYWPFLRDKETHFGLIR